MGLTCVEADSGISHEDDLVGRRRIYEPGSGLAVLVKECREVVTDELVRAALMKILVMSQPILNVHGDSPKGTVV